MAVASTNSLVSREDSTSRAAATITWTAAVLAGTVGVGDAVPCDPVPIPMPKGSTLQAVHTVSGFSTSSSLEGVLKGDEVASLIDCNDERCLRTRRKPTRHTRHSKISKGDVGTVLGACDDESKSDKADRVYVDFGEGKGRADFVKSELQLVNRVLKSPFTGDLNEQMTVFLPRRRISELELSDVVPAILVLGFVSVWTQAASSSDAPFLFVLFSAPFWYTGIIYY
jgi:hypothetical protein